MDDPHHYFLRRLGLVSDELDWPANFASASNADGGDGGDDDDDGSAAGDGSLSWRTRDALSSLLGEASVVGSDSGLTSAEVKLLASEDDNDATGGGKSLSEGSVSVGSLLAPYLPDVRNVSPLPGSAAASVAGAGAGAAGSIPVGSAGGSAAAASVASAPANNSSGGANNSEPRRKRLDPDIVNRAFDAAAYAIVRGDQRHGAGGESSSKPSAAADAGAETMAGAAPAGGPAIPAPPTSTSTAPAPVPVRAGRIYDPPLLMATEAIRTSRITSLVEASLNSKAVPPFLKKNNTIPWFHVPAATTAGRGGVSPATVEKVAASSSGKEKAGGEKKAGGDKGEKKAGEDSAKPSLAVKSSSAKASADKAGSKAGGSGGAKKRKAAGSGGVDGAKPKKDAGKLHAKKRPAETISSPAGEEEDDSIMASYKRMKLDQKQGSALTPSVGKEGEVKPDIDKSSGSKKKEKSGDSAGSSSAKKPKVAQAVKADKSRTFTPTSSSKGSTATPPPAASSAGRPNKVPRSPSTFENDPSGVGIEGNPTATRAVISAATAGVFQALHPDNSNADGGGCGAKADAATEREMSEIALEGTKVKKEKGADPPKGGGGAVVKKVQEEERKVGIDEVVFRAKRLGNRVLDQSSGAARRGDQRREFRADGALGKVDRGDHASLGDFGGYLGDRTRSASLSRDELYGPARSPNPFIVSPAHGLPLVVPNPFVAVRSPCGAAVVSDGGEDMMEIDTSRRPAASPPRKSSDPEWTESCLPRLLDVMNRGAGHAVVHDMQWNDRSGRIASLLRDLARPSPSSSDDSRGRRYPNYGPHLIVTSAGEDYEKFESAFADLKSAANKVVEKGATQVTFSASSANDQEVSLRVLRYHGSKDRRRELRKHFCSLSSPPESHLASLGGLPDSPFHVILTTYTELMEDHAHFCRIPFQCVILDDGMSWLGCAGSDPHGKLGKVWNSGLWSNFDFGAGCAGSMSDGGGRLSTWDFGRDVEGGAESGRGGDGKSKGQSKNSMTISGVGERSHGKPPLGLTARHRILLASSMHAKCGERTYKAPVFGLLQFLTPQFAEAVKEDWERSRIFGCKKSMSYVRANLARSIVTYSGDSVVRSPNDLVALSFRGLEGELPMRGLIATPGTDDEGVDELVRSQKVVHSRKFAASWFRPNSPVRREVSAMALDSILSATKKSTSIGHICEEIVPASTLTTSGAGGYVVGSSAYRAAMRCGRCFSSEQGLRQHMLSSHAPPGTWLCRSCGGDCGTSQARSHHERTCKAPMKVEIQSNNAASISEKIDIMEREGRPKKGPKRKMERIVERQLAEDEGGDRVPGYEGVWQLANGKYIAKVDGKPLMMVDSDSDNLEKGTPLLFSSPGAAAKKLDEVTSKKANDKEVTNNDQSEDSERKCESDTSGGAVQEGGKDSEKNCKSDDVGGGQSGEDEDEDEDDASSFNSDTDGDDKPPKRTPGVSPSGNTINFAHPDLSVIDIKKLPPHVKPLLRDPNFTSRAGGNSKRYVYAYRGVCRQQRKGHDRWQAQISFNGQNHYLGTFDSEWDAAAVYSWAHLILYGEEATRRAAREGEEAAAAFAQHEKDIADGKIPPPGPKPAKKKKRGAPKKARADATTGGGEKGPRGVERNEGATGGGTAPKSKRVSASSPSSIRGKKKRPASSREWGRLRTDCAVMLSSGTKGTSKATILATRKDVADMAEASLLRNVSGYISGHPSSMAGSFLRSTRTARGGRPSAVLIGLPATEFGWDMKKFIATCSGAGVRGAASLSLRMSNEFGPVGANKLFCAFILSPSLTLGRVGASKGVPGNKFLPSARSAGVPGAPASDIYCDVGGPDGSCGAAAARIGFSRTERHGSYRLAALNDDDIVTLNGRRVAASAGPHLLRDGDVCGVGARVFVFAELGDL